MATCTEQWLKLIKHCYLFRKCPFWILTGVICYPGLHGFLIRMVASVRFWLHSSVCLANSHVTSAFKIYKSSNNFFPLVYLFSFWDGCVYSMSCLRLFTSTTRKDYLEVKAQLLLFLLPHESWLSRSRVLPEILVLLRMFATLAYLVEPQRDPR